MQYTDALYQNAGSQPVNPKANHMLKNSIIAAMCAVSLSGCATYEMGGDVAEHRLAGDRILTQRTMWEIPPVCFSACTIKADRARPYACLGPKSKLGFHSVQLYGGGRSTDPWAYYSADLASVVRMPILPLVYTQMAGRTFWNDDLSRAYWMPREIALKFWPECK